MLEFNTLEEIELHVNKLGIEELIELLSEYPQGSYLYSLVAPNNTTYYHFTSWTADEQIMRARCVKNYASDANLWHISDSYICCNCRNCQKDK